MKKSWKEDPYLALLAYSNTPQQGLHAKKTQRHHPYSTTIHSPHRHAEGRQRSMAQFNKRVLQPLREFSMGKKVFVKPRPGNKHQPWIQGEVTGSPTLRSCTVNTSMGPVLKNHIQIRQSKENTREEMTSWKLQPCLSELTEKRPRAYLYTTPFSETTSASQDSGTLLWTKRKELKN